MSVMRDAGNNRSIPLRGGYAAHCLGRFAQQKNGLGKTLLISGMLLVFLFTGKSFGMSFGQGLPHPPKGDATQAARQTVSVNEKLQRVTDSLPLNVNLKNASGGPDKKIRRVIGGSILETWIGTGNPLKINTKSPLAGRFLQTDPVGYKDSMNLYQAFNQNPNNFIDPLGEYWRKYLADNKNYIENLKKQGYSDLDIRKILKTAYMNKILKDSLEVIEGQGEWNSYWFGSMFDTVGIAMEKTPNLIDNTPKAVIESSIDLAKKVPDYMSDKADLSNDVVKMAYNSSPIPDYLSAVDANKSIEERSTSLASFSIKMGGIILALEEAQTRSLASRTLRQRYADEVIALKDQIPKLRARGLSTEDIARKLHAERRALGLKYKKLSPTNILERIYLRNLEIYGDELGPTLEWLRKHNKSWEDIIESASRKGGGDLGF